MVNSLSGITQRDVMSNFYYNPDTGVIYRRIGEKLSIAGGFNIHGYITISFMGKRHYAHRFAWLYFYGKSPNGLIDHINGKKSDNRIENLRECDFRQNNLNSGKRCDNKSGYKGVYFAKDRNKWRAELNGKSLGSFKSAKEASDVYELAARRENGGFYRPRNLPHTQPKIQESLL